MSTISKIISFVIFVIFITILLNDGEQLTIKHCKEIQNEEYYCVISKKIKNMQNHGEISIYGVDLISQKKIILSPGSTGEGWLLFDKIEVGDSLIKRSGLSVFYITNYPKRDSVIFNCNR